MDLFVFNDIEKDDTIKAMVERDNIPLLRGIVRFAETEGVTSDSIKEYVVSLLANDDNILSQLARSGKKIGKDLKGFAKLDADLVFKKLLGKAAVKYSASGNDTGFYEGYIESIRSITMANSPEELLDRLILHYQILGCGSLAKYIAYRYDGEELSGIPDFDKTKFDDLVGLERQKKILMDNTEAFLDGKFSNNVLLFGDRGSGKSSSVKALLNMYADRGLRVVELPKSAITRIPKLTAELAKSPHKYILFLDDLTFERHDTEYRALKIAMEGQLQAAAGNVLVCATSNRRHLIRETIADREGGEFNVNDNMQEMLSLAERFGISLFFPSPDPKEYINIVKVLLERGGIEMTEDIRKEAVQWEMRYGGKSGRCAKQFVTDYVNKHGDFKEGDEV